MMMVDDDEKVDVSGMYQGLTYTKGEVNEVPDPAVHSTPPLMNCAGGGTSVEQLVSGRH